MKNVLNYYYNLNPNNIHYNKNYYFTIDGTSYCLTLVENTTNINEIYELSMLLISNNIYCHKIILNNQRNILTSVDNKQYLLFEIAPNLNRKINLSDIMNYNELTSGLNLNRFYKNNWYNLWINKIDYFEKQIPELVNRYPNIKKSFNFFSGMVELGISLLGTNNLKSALSISHSRIYKNYTLYDLYNPLNFIVDIKVRDIAEYIKSNLEDQPYELIDYYISEEKLTNDDCFNFFIRMLYPSFYFDKYEKIIDSNLDDSELEDVDSIGYKYEELIKKTYRYLKTVCNIKEIEWLK